jgi:hypothetical protein
MGLFTKREVRRAPLTTDKAHPAEDHRKPIGQVEDEMGLFGLGFHPQADQLAEHTLCSKPEAYFSCDPRRFHHEVL